MMQKAITGLKPQKSNPNRVNLYLDGEFVFGIPATSAQDLQIGDSLSETQLAELHDSVQLGNAYQAALHYLSYCPRTRKELEDRLSRKGIPENIVTVVVDRMDEMGMVSDAIFTKLWLESRSLSRPKSHRMLRHELQQKGVAPEIIEDGIGFMEDDETLAHRALEMRSRRWQGLEKQRFYSLAAGFLGRRGFSYQIIRKVLDEYWQVNFENMDN